MKTCTSVTKVNGLAVSFLFTVAAVCSLQVSPADAAQYTNPTSGENYISQALVRADNTGITEQRQERCTKCTWLEE
ncbi:MAG: hypothetical protein D3924_11320 [Candidatus Electrothrix sp. AR4]|nr:hypothetical protein [Candidatus Electrothrix sp. AR4]